MASKALRPNLVYDTTTLPLFSSYHKLINKLPSTAEIKNRTRSLMIKHKETDKQWLTLSFMSEKEKNPQKTDSKASFTLVDDAGTFWGRPWVLFRFSKKNPGGIFSLYIKPRPFTKMGRSYKLVKIGFFQCFVSSNLGQNLEFLDTNRLLE